ncbi:MAG: MFS transporter [Dehalococcoidia bacterium]|nr:MFS transporter [Dehalococcoidia bacterium]
MPSEAWKRNLYTIFVAELIVIMGFSFVVPFLPLYIQETGNLASKEAAFWTGIASFAASFAMFVSSPVWGVLADRWGRKSMVLRAMFGGGIIIALTGLVGNVYGIIAMRFLQGLVSGSVAAASALVASTMPRDKIPYAMGLLMVAVFGGNTFGPLLGGFFADWFGYQNTFFITGGVLFLGGAIVIFFVKENFSPSSGERSATLSGVLKLARSKEMLPILWVSFALAAGPAIVSPIISLLVKELSPGSEAATAAGTAFFLMGLVATVSSFIAGRVSQRVDLKKILIFSCLGTGFLYLPPMFAQNATQLIILVGMVALLKGGIMSTSNTLVGLVAPPNQQGIAYGVNQSASSLGSSLGPLLGGALAPAIGFKPIFGVTGAVYVLIGVVVARLLARVDLHKYHVEETAPARNLH